MYYAALLAEAYRKAGQTVEGLNVVTGALARAHQTWVPVITTLSCIASRENYC